VANRTDVVVLAASLLGVAAVLFLHTTGSWQAHAWLLHALGVTLALALATPLAVRILGEVVRGTLTVVATLGATAAIYTGARALVLPRVTPELEGLVHIGVIAGIVLVLVPGQAWLGRTIDRVVLGRNRRRWAELQEFLYTLSPELGASECCRRALAEVVRLMKLRGAAILLRDGEAMICGAVPLDAVLRVWPRGTQADALPADKVLGVELPQAELREALAEDGILGVQPIVSPRHRWGDMFFATGPFGLIFSDEEIATIASIAGRLALLLDGTELLARTVAAERVLAHREKLAALGELSARIAHEIRNPVTAARSLAQQLARLPSAADAEAARLILTELDRVERQVADLLRFARREDYRLEPADLAAVVRTAAQAVRPRLEAAGIGLVLELVSDLPTRCDREKIRQLVINLLENAGEALAGSAGPREVVVALRAEDGTAHLSVADNGPGVPADALPHLFEPFFSLKEHGTGLGLAIARRTVEAHGGRISARPGDAGGMRIEVALPLGAAGHSSPPRGTSGSEAAEGRTS
jgi:signal transduction histidine kinase